MATEIKTWEIIDGKLRPLDSKLADHGKLEAFDLEAWLASDPTIVRPGLKVIGRQVMTRSGPLDLLAINESGDLVVIELKRDKLPREALAQAIDYAADVASWSLERIGEICAKYTGQVLEDVFTETFPDTDLESVSINGTVMQGERTVKGVISWTTIGSRLVLRCSGDHVRDFMDQAREVSADTSLFAAIGAIVENQYVLVRDRENRISGIVTTSDLSLQFQQLAEPFLLLGEIENHIRRLIDGKFTADEVRAVRDPGDDRVVQSVADLTFGEYQRMLEHPDRWSKLRLNIERTSFIQQLDRVREIRNEVMHFDPDGTADEDLVTLRRFVRFLQMLQEIGAT